VFSQILASSFIVEKVGSTELQKAVFRTRRQQWGCSSLVRALSKHLAATIFRWDPVFLEPANDRAEMLRSFMEECHLNGNEGIKSILLEQTGDTLIVDNWQMLHGRTSVSAQSANRHIDRVYLSEVRQ
jgi:hypothetical protein